MLHRLSALVLFAAVAVVGCRAEPPVAMPRATTVLTTQLATSQPASLETRLGAILNRLQSSGAVCAARVVDPETGRELFSMNADRPMTPASNMKITVTSAALDFFGPDATFETSLIVAGDDLYLVGSGDPATGDGAIATKNKTTSLAFMDAWADELVRMGKTRFTGKLYYVDTAFEGRTTHEDWDADDLVEWYAAPVSGLNLNDNCIDVTVAPGKPGEPATLTVEPATTSTITLVNKTTTGDKTDAEIVRAVDSNTFTVTGTVAEKKTLQSKPVTDPGAFFADALRTHLAARGITIAGASEEADAALVGTNTSVRLKPATTKFTDVLARIMKNSQNLQAEGTAKYLGMVYMRRTAERSEPAQGSWTNAETAIRAFLTRNHIDDSHYVFADGSGLSGKNKVTTRLISDIFTTMYKSPHYEVWKNSLTIAGVDGTTRNRLKDKPNRVYCKTGYISGVRSLSGYVITDAGKTLVFSILYNNIPGRGQDKTKPYEELQDEALRVLMAE